ncbi:MAG TPA: hypothetical protein VER96_37575 [Polyangiaceae bacterium]|nr:hypothetical protein [Polyangiaceae bacterium]
MKNRSFVPGLLLLISAAVPALADDRPPAGDKGSAPTPGKHHDGPPGHDGPKGHDDMKGHEHPGRPGSPEHPDMRDGGAPGMHHEDRDGGAPGHHGYKNAWRDLYQDLKDGKIKKEDLKAKVAQLQETRTERRKEHREDVGKRWGSTLAKPSARDELKLHARRMAMLNRALVLAQEDTKPDKDKTIDRISKLIDKENARHEKAMTHIQSEPAAAATAAASAPAPSAANVASGGSQ